MPEQILKRPLTRFLVDALLIGLLAAAAHRAPGWQEDGSNLIRLFRLDGTFSEELSAKIRSDDKSRKPGFALTAARLEADNFGALTRLRALLTIANNHAERRITEVEWRLDVYDSALRSVSARVVQSDKVNVYAGESAVVSAKSGAVLPDRMIVLLQITKVMFAEGPAWVAAEECSLGEDLRTVSCKSK